MSSKHDDRLLLFMSNRWVNTIYPGYGIIKQRIFLNILQQLQPHILKVNNGAKIDRIMKTMGEYLYLELDMSQIVHHNNYWQVREAVKEMLEDTLHIYAPGDVKMQNMPELSEPLLYGWKNKSSRGRMLVLMITRTMAEKIIHCAKQNSGYTKFDVATICDPDRIDGIGSTISKYTYPLYILLSSWASKQGLTLDLANVRDRLGIKEKYAGFDAVRKLLRRLQAELKLRGSFNFNFEPVKTGKVVTGITFKIFPNTGSMDKSHVWFKIQAALERDLEHYRYITPEQREEFIYLLDGKYRLKEVYNKFLSVHRQLEQNKAQGEPVAPSRIFTYVWTSITKKYPPPD